MYKIEDLSNWFTAESDKVKTRVIQAQEQIAKDLEADVKSRAYVPPEAKRNPGQFHSYIDSITSKPTEVQGNKIINRVTSDMVVNDGSKWDGVPIGAFLEWGTGELGYTTNAFSHGFPYTLTGPWDLVTYAQWVETNTYGIPATPHFYPAVQFIKPRFDKRMKEILDGH